MAGGKDGRSRCSAPCCPRRFAAWLLLNSLLLRPLFGWLSARALAGWRCPPPDAGAEPGAGAGHQGLRLLVVSAGNSGSTAVHAALAELGVRAWGPEELMFYAPELEYARLRADGWNDPGGLLGACGVEAVVADAMTLPVVEAVLRQGEHHPEARLLVLRRDWRRWIASKRTTLARGAQSQLAVRAATMLLLCHWLPLGAAWAPGGVGASFFEGVGWGFTMELLDHCHWLGRAHVSMTKNGDRFARLHRELVSLMENETAYDAFLDPFRRALPEHRTWETDVRELTWTALANFSGRPTGQAGPLPRAKLNGWGKNIVRMWLHPLRHLGCLGVLVGSVALNWLLFCAVWAVARRSVPSGRPHAD